MSKPATQPRWATGGGALITTPSSGAQDTGHVPDTAPTAQLFNWFWNLVYQWIAYLDAFNASIATKFGAVAVTTSDRQVADVLQYRAELAALHNAIGVSSPGFSISMADVASNGAGTLVAVGSASGEIYTSSTLGRTWTARTPGSGFNGAFYGVIWASSLSLFVAVGNGTIQTSPDGITWTQRVSNAGVQNRCVAFGNGKIVVTMFDGASTYSVYTSTNGTVWSTTVMSVPLSTETLAFGNGVFVSPSDATGSANVYTSTDGLTWSTHTWGSSSLMRALQVRYVPVAGYFVALGTTTAGATRELQHSSDGGATWTQARVASGNGPGALITTDVAAYAFYGDRTHENWSWLNGECTAAGDFTTSYEWSRTSGTHARVLTLHGRSRVALSFSSDASGIVVAYFAASAA